MRVLFLALAFAVPLLAGCSGTNDVTTTHFTPDIVAVTSPDSLAPGQGLEIKVHWRSSLTCQSFEDPGIQPIDDSTFFVQTSAKEVHDPKTPCAARDTILEGGIHMTNPPAKRFRVLIYGA